MKRAALQWRCRDRVVAPGEAPVVMGIVNVTPDSFSDGGKLLDSDRAVAHALRLFEEGAEIIDVGGESTRPGAESVSAEEETRRVVPVVEELARRCGAVISVDTTKASVARAALEAGAHIVNDVSACTADAAMVDVVRARRAGVVLMHMRGTPRTMQEDPRYEDVVREVGEYLEERCAALIAAGVDRTTLAVDPGIGFGKTVEHNLALLAGIDRLADGGFPVVVGLSRKSFLGRLTGRPVDERLAGSIAALTFCVLQGVAVMRVHDVAASKDAAAVARALLAAGKAEGK